MKITRRQLRRLIKEAFSGYASERPNNPMERAYARKDSEESVGEMRSQEAISGTQTHMRTDGLSFEDFTGLIVDKLNLYDEWLYNQSVEDVVAELTGG